MPVWARQVATCHFFNTGLEPGYRSKRNWIFKPNLRSVSPAFTMRQRTTLGFTRSKPRYSMAATANLVALIVSLGSFHHWPRFCRVRTGFAGKPLNVIYTTAFEGFAALHLRCWPDFGPLTGISRPQTFVTAPVILIPQANPLRILPMSPCHRLHWLKLAAKALHFNYITKVTVGGANMTCLRHV